MVNITSMMNHNNKNHFNGTNRRKWITVHETGNRSKGANAKAHANLINNGYSITWHYTVDDSQIIQHFADTVQCWHAGDGNGNGNLNSIGIEMCINSDGNINKTIDNTIELIVHLMKKYNIPLSNVVQHNHWSGKDCPSDIRKGRPISWSVYKNKINDLYQGNKDPVHQPENNKKPEIIISKLSHLLDDPDYIEAIRLIRDKFFPSYNPIETVSGQFEYKDYNLNYIIGVGGVRGNHTYKINYLIEGKTGKEILAKVKEFRRLGMTYFKKHFKI